MHSVLLLSGGWTQALQLIAALSLLILLHELGHFIFAKLFKTRVEKFYLFFDFLFPFSGLLNFSFFKKKFKGTEYGIGWFPLGGYVKIAGMVDESMDKEALAKPPEPWEFRSKPAWQRLFIMLGGIIVNVLVAMIIYMCMFAAWGEDYLPTQSAKYGIMVDSVAENTIQLRNGDKILSVDGKPVPRFNQIMQAIIFDEARTVQVERDGRQIDLDIPSGTIRGILKSQRAGFLAPRVPVVVADVAPGSNAQKMGLRKNDSIIGVNTQPVFFFDEFQKQLRENTGKPVQLKIVRNGQYGFLSGAVDSAGKLGFAPFGPDRFLNYEHINYGFFQAMGKGFTFTFERFGFYWKQFKMIFTSKEVKASESLGGIVSFGKLFSPVFSWYDFWALTAFISIILAFMNLLPIPGLDGGYVIFILWEMITGRKVSEKVMERATAVGLVLLLALMVYANGLDIFRLFK